MLHVLFVHMHVVGHRFFGQMRELCTIGRANRIDAALVRLKIEKLTRSAFVHPFSLPVFEQPFCLEFFYGHVQMFGDALQVFECIGRRHVAAAVGARQAIDLLPHFFIDALCQKVEILRSPKVKEF